MSLPAATADGGVGIEPWAIPRFGGGGSWSSGRGIGVQAGRTLAGTSQGLGSTGVGGNFADAPGTVSGDWLPKHRGLLGGTGVRTGGYA